MKEIEMQEKIRALKKCKKKRRNEEIQRQMEK
jgi:hypothetical protein